MNVIRKEEPEDTKAIRRLNESAFGKPNEADLVDALRNSGALTLSLVGIENDEIVGHIAFSAVKIESDDATVEALGLGPAAVLPNHQRKGIGCRLVEAGLKECEKIGFPLVIVLGYPALYGRFGFIPAKPEGISWEMEVPDDVFMVKELRKGALLNINGVVRFHPAFNAV